MTSVNLTLDKFDISRIKFGGEPITSSHEGSKGPTIVMIGRRGTGKSYLIKDLLYHFQTVPVGTVISGTEEGNGFFSEIVPKIFIHDEYNTDIIDNVMKRQKHLTKVVKRDLSQYGRSSIDARTFLVMDDCLFDDKWTRDKIMRMLFMNGRHWRIMLVITMQYALGIPPALRTNVDYVFIMRETSTQNRKRLYDNFASAFPTYESFCQVLDACTDNYECMVVDNTTQSNKLTDQIFWYKAQDRPSFRIGSSAYWKLSVQMGSAATEDSAPRPGIIQRKKSAPLISVFKNGM